MSKYTAFNLNQYVLVKLLPDGLEMLLAHHMRYVPECWRKTLADFEGERDEHGYTKFQLWQFMQVFGSHMTLGSFGLFSNTILFYPNDLEPINLP